MQDKPDVLKGPIVRLFGKLSEWVGLSDNVAPAAAALFLERYGDEERLGSDDICEVTGYSRANAGLIISQLEALGVVSGQRDYEQTGRGRKRLLYKMETDIDSFVSLGIQRIADLLKSMLKDIDAIEQQYGEDDKRLAKMMRDLRNAIERNLASLQGLPAMRSTTT